jgi:hypothetical protein
MQFIFPNGSEKFQGGNRLSCGDDSWTDFFIYGSLQERNIDLLNTKSFVDVLSSLYS